VGSMSGLRPASGRSNVISYMILSLSASTRAALGFCGAIPIAAASAKSLAVRSRATVLIPAFSSAAAPGVGNPPLVPL
jgi:hypothetical protein